MKNKIISFLLAFLAAFSLWIYVMTVENPQDTKMIYNIPVTFSGQEDLRDDLGLLITNVADNTINIEISGKRSIIQRVEADKVSAVVDVSRLKAVGQFKLDYDLVFAEDVNEDELVITERTPSQINFTVEQRVQKVLEVKGTLDGQVAEGYTAEPMVFDYEEIVIQGPANVVETVQYAQVVLSRTNLEKTVTTSTPYELIDSEGNVVSSTEIYAEITEIEVTQPVSKIKELPLVVEYIPGGGATAENVSTEIKPNTITVSGDAAIVDSINQIVLDNIDLSDIHGNTSLEYPIIIPNGLKNISGAESATVEVNIRGLDTVTLRATNVDFINVPPGYSATSMTQMLQIMLRGPSNTMEDIQTQNLRVVADLVEWTSGGSYSVPVKIYVDGHENVGILGDYTIVVSLEKESEVVDNLTTIDAE